MRRGARRKSIIYGLVLALIISFLPEVAFSATRSFRRSGNFRGPAAHSRHRFDGRVRPGFRVELGRADGLHRFRDPFNRSGFQSRVGDGFGFIGGQLVDVGDVVVIQVPSSAANQPRGPAQSGTYVDPHWVDGGHGVEILRPGYWSDAKQRVER